MPKDPVTSVLEIARSSAYASGASVTQPSSLGSWRAYVCVKIRVKRA